MAIYKDQSKKKKQLELANLFYEMGMSIDVIEKISGVESNELLNNRFAQLKKTTKTIDKKEQNNYNNDIK